LIYDNYLLGIYDPKKVVMSNNKKPVQSNVKSSRPQKVPKATGPTRSANPLTDPEVAQYLAATIDPFSDAAVGARICDIANDATLTAKCEGVVNLISNSAGTCSFLISANPVVSVIDLTTSSITASQSLSNYGGNTPYVFAAANFGNLSGVMSSARVVGGGFRLRNQMIATACQGRVIWAELPVTGDPVGYSTMLNVGETSNAAYTRMTGQVIGSAAANATGGAPASILTFPHAGEFSMQDIITNTMEFVFRKASYDFTRFHNTNIGSTIATGITYGTGLAYSSSGILTQDNQDCVNYEGYNCFVITITGCPVSTLVAELEYIYHLEGSPPTPSSAVGLVVPDTESKVVINTAMHQKVVDLSAMSTPVKMVEEFFAGNYIESAKSASKYGSQIIGKKATRRVKEFINNSVLARTGLSL
jgi:hypothetical protein